MTRAILLFGFALVLTLTPEALLAQPDARQFGVTIERFVKNVRKKAVNEEHRRAKASGHPRTKNSIEREFPFDRRQRRLENRECSLSGGCGDSGFLGLGGQARLQIARRVLVRLQRRCAGPTVLHGLGQSKCDAHCRARGRGASAPALDDPGAGAGSRRSPKTPANGDRLKKPRAS